MKSYKNALLAVLAALAISFVTTGCDRTVNHTESEKVKSDGTVEKKESTTTQSPDGSTKKEDTKSTEKP